MVQRKTKPTSIVRLLEPFVVMRLSSFFVVSLIVSHCSHLSDLVCFIPLDISVICLKQKTFRGTLHAFFFPLGLFLLGSFTTRRPFEAFIPAFYPFLSILDHRQCFRAFCRLWPSSVRTTRVRSCSAASCLSTSLLSSRMGG